MKSLDSLLGEAITKMTPGQLRAYRNKTQGGEAQETLISIAESVLAEGGTEIRESRSIRRNNGGSRQVTEAERFESVMAETDNLMFSAMESARPQTAKGLGQMTEVNGSFVKAGDGSEIKESQRSDYDFCRLLGMSHEESLKVLKSGGIKD